ncbi:MAG: amidohydrolase [Saprospiraceae bacterium]|nr:amidohydrolase [Saprospiraceae bacterium]
MKKFERISLYFLSFLHQKPTMLPMLLIIVVAMLGCAQPKEQVDVLLFNGQVITMSNDHIIAEAIAIKDGKFLAVGNSREITRKYSGSHQEIDLQGLTVIPGIIEGHVHPIGASTSEHFEKIPDLKSIEDLLKWIQHQAQIKNSGDWIIHPKFFATRLLDMRQPSMVELDAVAPDHPVFLNGSYGGMVNTRALRISGISSSIDHPGFIKDSISGDLTGMIRRSAFNLLSLPPKKELSNEQQLKDLEKLLHHYNSVGITSICAGSGSTKDLQMFQSLRDKSILTARIFQNISIPFHPKDSLNNMRAALDSLEYHTGSGDDWIRVGALKAVIDGGVLTGTAYLREPWGLGAKEIYGITDPNYRGVLMLDKEQLVHMMTAAVERNWKFTSHVTGGGGVDVYLNALEEVSQTQKVVGRRFSIIHGNFFNDQAIEKMKKLDVYADMQPAWFLKDADLLNQVLGEDRMQTFHPYNALMEAGIVVNGGSDHMVKLDSYKAINPYNPFLSIWSVVTRKTERNRQYAPSEAISRPQAMAMYTINNAYASFEEDRKGSIESGKLADLAVLSDDIYNCAEEKIKDIQVVLTMVDGKIVYENESINRLIRALE